MRLIEHGGDSVVKSGMEAERQSRWPSQKTSYADAGQHD